MLARPAPAPSGLLVANPPYGVRLEDEDALAAFYPKLGDALKQHFAGWTACLLTGDARLPKLIGLKPSKRTPLYNGAIECRLFRFEIVTGRPQREARAGRSRLGRRMLRSGFRSRCHQRHPPPCRCFPPATTNPSTRGSFAR